jgi:VIT1/CCC1 family predicted Fe2+/Mn2+ transporter
MEHIDLELYIQIRDGQPHEHPIFADNFRQAFPDVDTENLPDTFAKFIRVDAPVPDTYEVYEGVTYQWIDGVVKDVHSVRAMTEEERAAKDIELTELATQNANALHQIRMERCQTTADETEDATQKQLWLDCLAAHQAWVLESVNPITPAFPLFPNQD